MGGVGPLRGVSGSDRHSGVVGRLSADRPASLAWHYLGIVEGFVKWCLKEGYAVSTVNNRLSAIKVYAKLAAKAGVNPAEELQLIRLVSGYGKQEGKRIDECRPVNRVGHKKAAPAANKGVKLSR